MGRAGLVKGVTSKCIYAAGVLNLGIDFNADFSNELSSSISKSSCKPNQNLAELPKYFEKRKAVSAVILR